VDDEIGECEEQGAYASWVRREGFLAGLGVIGPAEEGVENETGVWEGVGWERM
jgi:hypothetical protein